MYISDNAIKKLKTYLVIVSLIFVLAFVFSFSGLHVQSIGYENYYYDDSTWETFEEYYDFGALLFTISGLLFWVGAIMVFVITGIILCINRFKMKDKFNEV